MAKIEQRYTRLWELELRLTTMFPKDRNGYILFVNDYTEEGSGGDRDSKLVLFYVRVEVPADDAPPLRKDCDVHVGTWNKEISKGWIFQAATKLFKESVR